MIKRNLKFNSGSFAVEGAIVLPLVIILIFFFIWQLIIIRTEMIYKTILVKESEKSSLYGYIYEYADILYNEISQNHINEDIYDVVFTNIYEEIYINSLEKHLMDHLNKNPNMKVHIKKHEIQIEKDLFYEGIYLTSKYTVSTPLGDKVKYFTFPLRLWANGDNTGKIEVENIQNVWEMNNFQRGRIIRKRFGGNLPFGFPVLSGYQNNCALIIKSMDLNAITWNNTESVKRKLISDIDKLIYYNGTNGNWGKDKINISKYDIHQKYIKFVFPEDIEYDKYAYVFNDVKEYSKRYNIIIELIFFQNSICKNNEQNLD